MVDCTCGVDVPINMHTTACPASLYQAGIQRGRAEERTSIVAWLRETGRYDNPWHLGDAADCIERGEHVVVQAAPPLRPIRKETP